VLRRFVEKGLTDAAHDLDGLRIGRMHDARHGQRRHVEQLDIQGRRDSVPVAAIALIVMGILLLVRTLDLFNFEYVARYWPVLLIAAGVYLLYGRFSAHGQSQEEVRHERQ